jgi:hypothetical protein
VGLEYELRIYAVAGGAMDAWVSEWSQQVRPLRERFGFAVIGPWLIDENTFAWVLGYEGDFDAADRAYYASAERASVSPDPARHLENVRSWRVREG